MSSSSGKSMKLRFKGDAKPKSKKRKSTSNDDDGYSGPAEGWVTAECIEDLSGPIIIVSQATDPSSTLYCAENNAVSFKKLLNNDVPLNELEPTDVGQVFIATILPTTTPKISLKSAYEKYLTTDKFGIVSCDTEAIGPTSEWEIVKREDGFAFQTYQNQFLSLNVNVEKSKGNVRADVENVGFKEVFLIRCQAQNKFKNKKKKAEEVLDAEVLDMEFLKKSQSYKRAALTPEEIKLLKRAQKEGNLQETMLERRAKTKADKFCK
ncbi:hypothetical protein HDU76_003900 [Blyttiomyces sp. JEL0837]|nr:hypothetical protein HDU76_003900 [Blyttiomyces sp. JEL0837]